LPGYWMWNVNIYQPSTSTFYRLGDNNYYSTATDAFDANKNFSLEINISSDENLWFYISDTSASNNYGEVTINIALVPEPISSVLFVTGSAVFAGRAYLKKKRSKTLTHKEVS